MTSCLAIFFYVTLHGVELSLYNVVRNPDTNAPICGTIEQCLADAEVADRALSVSPAAAGQRAGCVTKRGVQ